MSTATTLQKLKKIEDLLTCSVCLEILKLPKTLSCGHIFCQDCIVWIGNDTNWNIQCPTCRQNQLIINCPEDVYLLNCSCYVKQALDIIVNTPVFRKNQYQQKAKLCKKYTELESVDYADNQCREISEEIADRRYCNETDFIDIYFTQRYTFENLCRKLFSWMTKLKDKRVCHEKTPL